MIDNRRFFGWVESVLADGECVRIKVRGTSMLPLLRDGIDKVCVKPYRGERLRRYDIVLFRYMGEYVMHRAVELDGDGLRLQGDGLTRSWERCGIDDVVGIVTEIQRNGGKWRSISSFGMRLYIIVWRGLGRLRGPIISLIFAQKGKNEP